MKKNNAPVPDFLLIGAQKAGTTWLWKLLDAHPETDLPSVKEIHFFGGIENYKKGRDWYYGHFSGLNSDKVIGDGSTTYFFDMMPYWHNLSNRIETDPSLPSIPEIIANELPEVKIVVILRDPVRRAVSAYKHWMRKDRQKGPSPLAGLRKIAVSYPKFRIIEAGFYAKYLKLWMEHVPPERLKVLIFEKDIRNAPYETLKSVYRFLNMDPDFTPPRAEKAVHSSMDLSKIVLKYYMRRHYNNKIIGKMIKMLNINTLIESKVIQRADLKFLRSIYLPEKPVIEELTGRDLSCWDYGV